MSERELASFIALGLMFFSVMLITFARTKTKGVIRIVLSIIAFVLLIPTFLYSLMVLL